MNIFSKTFAIAGLAGAAIAASPLAAQVSGSIGIVNPPATIAASQALNTAYQQINTTYASQIQQIQQKQS